MNIVKIDTRLKEIYTETKWKRFPMNDFRLKLTRKNAMTVKKLMLEAGGSIDALLEIEKALEIAENNPEKGEELDPLKVREAVGALEHGIELYFGIG